VNLKYYMEIFEPNATFAERMATKVDGIGLAPSAQLQQRSSA